MPWNAAQISDYQLHRRRLLLACIGAVLAVAMVADLGLSSGGNFELRREAICAFYLIMLLYFARMALREWRRMKVASR